MLWSTLSATNCVCNKWDTAEDYHTGQLTVYSRSVHHMIDYILSGGAAMSCHQNYDPRKQLVQALKEIWQSLVELLAQCYDQVQLLNIWTNKMVKKADQQTWNAIPGTLYISEFCTTGINVFGIRKHCHIFSLQQPTWMALYSLIVLMCR